MKASELIKRLQELVEEYGDLEVDVNDEKGGDSMMAKDTTIEYKNHFKEKSIVLWV